LMIDVTLPALNAALGFLDVSLQDGLLHRTSYRSSMESGPLSSGSNQRQKRVSLTKHDSRSSHIQTEGGLRRIGQRPDVDEGGA
jgi:hypothetical protein